MKRYLNRWLGLGVACLLCAVFCWHGRISDANAGCNVPPDNKEHEVTVTAGAVVGPLEGCFCVNAYPGTTFGNGSFVCICDNSGSVSPNPTSLPTTLGHHTGTVTWAATCGCASNQVTVSYDITLYELVEDSVTTSAESAPDGVYASISGTYKSNPEGCRAGDLAFTPLCDHPFDVGTYEFTGIATGEECPLTVTRVLEVYRVTDSDDEGTPPDTDVTDDEDEELDKSDGDPIDTSNGNVYFSETDIAVPCPGIPLVFSRRYNSIQSVSSPLGKGWTHSYNWFLNPSEFRGRQSRTPKAPRTYCADDAKSGMPVKLKDGDAVVCPANSSIELGGRGAITFDAGSDATTTIKQSSQGGKVSMAFAVPAGAMLIHENGDPETLAAGALVSVAWGDSCTIPSGAKVAYAGGCESETFPNGTPVTLRKSHYCGRWIT